MRSCACERVFSLVAHLFGPDRNRMLADGLGVSLKLRYNKRRVG